MTKYQFDKSTLEDSAIKKLVASKSKIFDVLQQEDSENPQKDFKSVVKDIFICLPNSSLPGHMYTINFMVEFKEGLNAKIDKSDVVYYLETELRKFFDIEVNIYSDNQIKAKLENSFLLDCDKPHVEAMLNARIPLSEFNCKTNQELNDKFHANFIIWQQSRSKSPSRSPSTKGDAIMSEDVQFQQILGLDDEQYLEFRRINSTNVIDTIKQNLASLMNNSAELPLVKRDQVRYMT